MKPFCSAKQGIAAVEAFRAILASPVRPNAIAKVRVRVPRAYAGMIATPAEPGARQSTLVSVAHQIALAALQPERLYDVDRSVAKPDKDIAQFAAKVEVIADAELDAFYPAALARGKWRSKPAQKFSGAAWSKLRAILSVRSIAPASRRRRAARSILCSDQRQPPNGSLCAMVRWRAAPDASGWRQP